MAELWLRDVDEITNTPVTSLHPLPVKEVAPAPLPVYRAFAFEQVTVAATAIGLTQTTYLHAIRAVVQVESAQVRYRYEGATVPTATVGTYADPGDILILDGPAALANFSAIRTGGVSATLNATYLVQEAAA